MTKNKPNFMVKIGLWLLKKKFITYFKREFGESNCNLQNNKEQTNYQFMNDLNEKITNNCDKYDLKRLKLKKRMLKSSMERTVNLDITANVAMIMSITIFFTSCINALVIKSSLSDKYDTWIIFLIIASIVLLGIAIIAFILNSNSKYEKSFLVFYLDILEYIEKDKLKEIDEEKLKCKEEIAVTKEKDIELKINELLKNEEQIKKFIGIK